MRTLCFGGSFNPIHYGHLISAQAAAEAAGFDRLLLIPNAHSPHKLMESNVALAADRLTMCQLATAKMSSFAVSEVEVNRAGPSFTLHTARDLQRATGDKTHWLIGGDTVSQLRRWHEPEALMEEVQFVVVARPGWSIDWTLLGEPYRRLREHVVPAPLIDISATGIRLRVAEGRPIDFYTPPAVVQYIEQRGLYQRP